MNDRVKQKWDNIYNEKQQTDCSASQVLTENDFLLPESGTALDLACGQGGNAFFLAHHGLNTEAWDISGVAVGELQKKADKAGLNIHARERNIDIHSLENFRFDVIVVSRFLDRSINNAIIGALNTGGLLFYQTYTREKAIGKGPNNPDYLLTVNELLVMFSSLRVVFYRENGTIGRLEEGLRNEAQFIGQKL